MGPLIFLGKSRKIFSTEDICGFCNQKVDVRGVRMQNGGCLAVVASIKAPPPVSCDQQRNNHIFEAFHSLYFLFPLSFASLHFFIFASFLFLSPFLPSFPSSLMAFFHSSSFPWFPLPYFLTLLFVPFIIYLLSFLTSATPSFFSFFLFSFDLQSFFSLGSYLVWLHIMLLNYEKKITLTCYWQMNQ